MLNKGVKGKEVPGHQDTFRMEIQKDFEGVLTQCKPSLEHLQRDLSTVERFQKARSDSELKLSNYEKEAERLRAEISLRIGKGENADDQVRRRAAVLSELSVIRDLIDDLAVSIPAAEVQAQKSGDALKKESEAHLVDLSVKHQARIYALALEMGELVQTYTDTLQEFLDAHAELKAGWRPDIPLHFPQLSRGDQPEWIISRIEQGLI